MKGYTLCYQPLPFHIEDKENTENLIIGEISEEETALASEVPHCVLVFNLSKVKSN